VYQRVQQMDSRRMIVIVIWWPDPYMLRIASQQFTQYSSPS
jgi:hypothetical protein